MGTNFIIILKWKEKISLMSLAPAVTPHPATFSITAGRTPLLSHMICMPSASSAPYVRLPAAGFGWSSLAHGSTP